MSTDRDTTRIVRSWLEEGVTALPDTVLDAVLDELPATPQRRVGWPVWRTPTMNRFMTIGLAAAAVLVLVFIGAQLVGSPTGAGGPGVATPTPQATATPTATPQPTPMSLPQGRHVLTDGTALDGMDTLPTTLDIVAPGWFGDPGEAILTKHDTAVAPEGAGIIVFFGGLHVYGDPCRWSTTRPDVPATTVDELMAALAAQASRDASEPVDIMLDGHAGKAITLHVPDDAVFTDCDRGTFGSWGVPGADEAPFRYHQDPGQIDEVWAVDVDGTLAVVDGAYYEGTPQAVVDEIRAMIESITFE